MLKSSFLSLLGLVIAHRTHVISEKNNLFTNKFSTQRHVLVLFLQLLMSFFLFEHLHLLFFEIVVVFLTPLMMMKVTIYAREGRMRAQFVSLLDSLIIRMRAGKSFRDAFVQILPESDPLVRVLLTEFHSSLIYKRPLDELFFQKDIRDYFQELTNIDEQNHKSIERLKSFRRTLKVRQDFRQKSRQAMQQVHAQALILSLMYVLLLFVLVLRGEATKYLGLVTGSAVLFAVGLFCLQLIGRGYKWKI